MVLIKKQEKSIVGNNADVALVPSPPFPMCTCKRVVVSFLTLFTAFAVMPLFATAAGIPSITVLSPNGGEHLATDSKYDIKWTSSGVDPQSPVSIQLIDNTQNKTYEIESYFSKVGDGKLTWSHIPAHTFYNGPSSLFTGNKFTIKISVATKDVSAQYGDQSDNYFSIVTPAAAVLYKTEFDGGTLYGSLYKSTDGGGTWKEILRQYKGNIVYSIDTNNPFVLYAGDSAGNQMAEDMNVNLFTSTNGGDHWTDISKGITDQVGELYGVSSLSVDRSHSNIVTVTVRTATASVSFISTDYGNTWVKEAGASSASPRASVTGDRTPAISRASILNRRVNAQAKGESFSRHKINVSIILPHPLPYLRSQSISLLLREETLG